MAKGKVWIDIKRQHKGCRWIWDVWIDGSPHKSGVVDTLKEATDAVLESLDGE